MRAARGKIGVNRYMKQPMSDAHFLIARSFDWTADISGSNRFLPLSTAKDTDISGNMDIGQDI